MDRDLDAALIDELRRVHGVHTVILYGSRARGTETAESDVDVAGFADTTATPTATPITRDARLWNGLYLDGFVYPTSVLTAAPDAELLKFLGARVLLDERQLAGTMLERIAALELEGPPRLVQTEQRMRLRPRRRDLEERGLDGLAGETERVGALFLELVLDRGDGVVRERGMLRVAQASGMPCHRRLVS